MADKSFGNPLINDRTFGYSSHETMTRFGVAAWTGAFMLTLVLGAAYSWNEFNKAIGDFDISTLQTVQVGTDEDGKAISEVRVVDPNTGEYSSPPQFDLSYVNTLAMGGALGAFVIAMITIFGDHGNARFLGFVYSGLEGLAVGAFSASFELKFPGIALQAAGITFGISAVMWFLFATGILRATRGLVAGVLAAMLVILGLYIVDIFLPLDLVRGNSTASIITSFVIVGVCALNFTIDYTDIEYSVQRGAPKREEAYAAFALMLSFVWCYLEVVRLLAKMRSKDLRSETWANFVSHLLYVPKTTLPRIHMAA